MKRKVKILCSLGFIILYITLLCCPAYAVDYGVQYPDYVPQSSGCFIECNSNIGKGCLLLPYEFVDNSIGYYNNNQFCNLTKSTINGVFITENGTSYSIRCTALGGFQYVYSTGYQSSYQDLTFNSIYNTNCTFLTENSENQNNVYHLSDTDKIIISLIVLIMFFNFFELSVLIIRGKSK